MPPTNIWMIHAEVARVLQREHEREDRQDERDLP